MNTKIKFGTDGWRAVIAEGFTFENVRRVAQATADYWNQVGQASRLSIGMAGKRTGKMPVQLGTEMGTLTGKMPVPLGTEMGTLTGRMPVPQAIVGYDNRFFSEVYAKLVCEVLAANGLRVLVPPESVPTPAVSYAVRDRRLCGAVMITASHNPPSFNGYKIKADFAGPADPEICAEIEKRIDQSPVRKVDFDEAVKAGRIEIYDPRPAHVASVKPFVDLRKIRGAGLKVVIDSMHGSGGTVLQEILAGRTRRLSSKRLAGGAPALQGRLAGGAPGLQGRVDSIRSDRDVLFGGVNPEPIGKNLGALCAAVKKARADIGLATDGDADRMGVVDDRGRYVSIQLVFALLLLHLARNRSWSRNQNQNRNTRDRKGVVVKSANCTVLIDRICRAHGLECVEVPVGFKYICAKMRESDVLLGGEESGGMGFQGHIPERDGILANLMLLEMLAVTKRSVTRLLSDLQQEFGRSAYDRIDMHYPLEKRGRLIETLRRDPPGELLGSPLAAMKDFDGVKYIAKDESWLMFRASGTEPIVRIYSEAASAARVKRLLDYGRRLAERVAAG